MESFFNCNEDDFKELSKKNKIIWSKQFKNNKNSIIEYGKDSKNTLLCLKHIPISNDDFTYIQDFPKNGEITTCWRELYIYQMMESIHKNINLLIIFLSILLLSQQEKEDLIFHYYFLIFP